MCEARKADCRVREDLQDSSQLTSSDGLPRYCRYGARCSLVRETVAPQVTFTGNNSFRAASMPSAAEVKSLYKAFLREGKKFSNYNVREFVQRKAKTQFRRYASETDASVISQVWAQAKRDIDVAKRQALVYSLYGSKQKSVMDIPMVKVLQKQAESAPYSTA